MADRRLQTQRMLVHRRYMLQLDLHEPSALVVTLRTMLRLCQHLPQLTASHKLLRTSPRLITAAWDRYSHNPYFIISSLRG